ncbi:unnamed protein product [Musa hybrid cultivar]
MMDDGELTSEDMEHDGVQPRILLAAFGSVAAIKFEMLCRWFFWSGRKQVRVVATKSSLHVFSTKLRTPRVCDPLYTDDDEWSQWKKLGDEVFAHGSSEMG